jgi:hypothetical protein
MPLVMVEQVFEGNDGMEEKARKRVATLEPCLAARAARWMGTYLSTDFARSICVFEAPDAQSVRDAFTLAGVKYVRVWPVVHHTPPA